MKMERELAHPRNYKKKGHLAVTVNFEVLVAGGGFEPPTFGL